MSAPAAAAALHHESPAVFAGCRRKYHRVKASSSGKVPQGALVQANLGEGDLSSEVPAETLDQAARLVGPGRTVCLISPGARGAAASVCQRGE